MDISKHIINLTPGNLYWKDKDGKYLGCNSNFAKIAGLSSPEEIIGKTDRELFLEYLGESRIKALAEIDQAVIASGKAQTVREAGTDAANKLVFYISKKAPLVDESNNIIGIIGNSIESTPYDYIKDTVISSTAGNLYWKDRKGIYLGCNDAFAEILGLESPKYIVGKNDYELTLDAELVKEIIKTDQAVINFDTEITLEETGMNIQGTTANYISKKKPLKDVDGNIIGLVGTSIDVTKQKQAELIKTEFLRNMSHDIRTPLVGIYSLAAMLYSEETDPEKRSMLGDLVNSSERLNALLNQVLEVSKLGTYDVNNIEFRIDDLIDESISLLFAAIKSKKITFKLTKKEGAVKTDRGRLSRILSNILSNAVKFTPDYGHIQITIETIRPILRIVVEDSGIGISTDKLESIFEKFTKLAPSAIHQDFTGSGIGLYTAKYLASELGGEIYVESELGKGTKFSIHIPSID